MPASISCHLFLAYHGGRHLCASLLQIISPLKKGTKTQALSVDECQVYALRFTDTQQGPLCCCLNLPVLILDHGIHNLLHFLGKVRRVWGQFLGRWPSTLLLLLALIVFVTAAGAGGRGGGAGLAVPLALA